MIDFNNSAITIVRTRSDGYEFMVHCAVPDDGPRAVISVRCGCHLFSRLYGEDPFADAKRFYENHKVRSCHTTASSKALDIESLAILARLEHQLDIAPGAPYVPAPSPPSPLYANGNPTPFTEDERRNFEEVARSFAPPQAEDWGMDSSPPSDRRTE